MNAMKNLLNMKRSNFGIEVSSRFESLIMDICLYVTPLNGHVQFEELPASALLYNATLFTLTSVTLVRKTMKV